MRCRICNKEFNRGTSTLPFSDICTECHEKYVKIALIEKSQDEINEYYQSAIDYHLKEINNLMDEIKLLQNNIEFFKSQIKIKD